MRNAEQTQLIAEAHLAWRDGYNVVATALNGVLRQVAQQRKWKRIPRIDCGKVDVASSRPAEALRACRARLVTALCQVDLPYHVYRRIDDPHWEPWSVGDVNGHGGGTECRVGAGYRQLGTESLDLSLNLLAGRLRWTQANWQAFIINPIETSAAKWAEWFSALLRGNPKNPEPAEEATRSEPWPPDKGWHFLRGLVAFRGKQYELSGIPLHILQRFVESATPELSADHLRTVWDIAERDTVEDSTIRTHVGKVRKVLRCIARDTGAGSAIQDPLPNRGGGWRFLLPKK